MVGLINNYLCLFSIYFCFCFSQSLNDPSSLKDSNPVKSKIDPQGDVQYFVYDASSLDNGKVYISLSSCGITPQEKTTAYLELYYSSDISKSLSEWTIASSSSTFKTLNKDIVDDKSRKGRKEKSGFYEDYYSGFRSAEIDVNDFKRKGDKIYLAVQLHNHQGDGSITFQITGSSRNLIDKTLFDFPLSLLDTDIRSSSLMANITAGDADGYQVRYAKFYDGRKFNTICSIGLLKSKALTANKDNFKQVINFSNHPPQRTLVTQYEAYIDNLEPNTKYIAWLVKPDSASKTSGTIHPPVFFKTKQQSSSCVLARNLDFCNEVYYSVPVPARKQSEGQSLRLSEIERKGWESKVLSEYDSKAQEYFENFKIAIDQYDCKYHEYSPVRNCNDCLASYKTWLCAALLPKCIDKVGEKELLDLKTPSPISYIDTNPDTKKWLEEMGDVEFSEIKLCHFVCAFVMQSCPTDLNFKCPSVKHGGIGYFDTPNGLGSLANHEIEVWKSNFSSNDPFISKNQPYCNSLLYRLQLDPAKILRAQGYTPSTTLSLSLLSIMVLYFTHEFFEF